MLQPSDTTRGPSNRCRDARAQLDAYVAGELGSTEHQLISAHLESCADCHVESERYRDAMSLLTVAPIMHGHGDLYSGFAEKLAHSEMRRGRRQLRLRWVMGSASLLAVAAAGAWVGAPLLIARPAKPVDTSPLMKIAKVANPAERKFVAPPVAPKPVDPDDQQQDFWKMKPDDRSAPDQVASGQSGSGFVWPETRSRGRRHNAEAEARVDSGGSGILSGGGAELPASIQAKPEVNGGTADEEIVARRVPVKEESRFSSPAPSGTQPLHPVADADNVDPSLPPKGIVPVADPRLSVVVPQRDARIQIGSKRADVQTAVGLDRSGRPVMVNVNIANVDGKDAGGKAAAARKPRWIKLRQDGSEVGKEDNQSDVKANARPKR